MRLQDFKVLIFDMIGTLIDYERGVLDYLHGRVGVSCRFRTPGRPTDAVDENR
jgi:hypothetical protein